MLLDGMAEPKTIFDERDDAIEEAAMERARAEIAEGRGLAHEKVGAWLRRLAAGERAPPPEPD